MEKEIYFIMVGNYYVKHINSSEEHLILTKLSNERREFPTLNNAKFVNRALNGKIFKEVTTIKVREES